MPVPCLQTNRTPTVFLQRHPGAGPTSATARANQQLTLVAVIPLGPGFLPSVPYLKEPQGLAGVAEGRAVAEADAITVRVTHAATKPRRITVRSSWAIPRSLASTVLRSAIGGHSGTLAHAGLVGVGYRGYKV
jgi:hypothetical protein